MAKCNVVKVDLEVFFGILYGIFYCTVKVSFHFSVFDSTALKLGLNLKITDKFCSISQCTEAFLVAQAA